MNDKGQFTHISQLDILFAHSFGCVGTYYSTRISTYIVIIINDADERRANDQLEYLFIFAQTHIGLSETKIKYSSG